MNENITFEPLKEEHFQLLLRWLKTPHVKRWWDTDINWTIELIEKRYGNYVKGFKRLVLATQVIEKSMHAFIINFNKTAIGYIQFYNKHDFPPEQGYDASDLPDSCAAIDWYIGELDYVGKGIGSQALDIFLNEFVFKIFENVFVDSETANIGAIRVYEKVGFKKIREDNSVTLMIKNNTNGILH
ncbi:GNAT family N-acetyltransferase [Wolbachia endosymbiont of Folsomia candida]|uniref:GNAT family N-acetyltransferase n=1 Tax=Wolbachia endosymbiont of Folsomia candida TaxID=169402 RepID=UPI000A76A22B|nr:GNAT family N-acetyltransferase [Wolbachia endosymbiont of Folsomia candida]APR98152.1 N-acetyltransferase [Wolbachia endosymbiont of Folsomia candida]